MCPARTHSPKLGIPTCPQPFLAYSGRPSGINPAPRQHSPADGQTLTRHPGNTFRHTISHIDRHPGNTFRHTLSHIDPAPWQHINPAWHSLPMDSWHHPSSVPHTTMLI